MRFLTHDFVRLIALLKSCSGTWSLLIRKPGELQIIVLHFDLGRVNQFINRPKDAVLSTQDIRTLTMVVYIVALLCEHCNFEQIRSEHSGTLSCLEIQGHV